MEVCVLVTADADHEVVGCVQADSCDAAGVGCGVGGGFCLISGELVFVYFVFFFSPSFLNCMKHLK